ncbi:MAG: glutamyl-tRNA reductase [Gemmataceae bacterium]
MIFLVIGCNYRNTSVEVRERLAFEGDKLPRTLHELEARFGCESVILSTCNRVEIYLARTDSHLAPQSDLVAEFLGEIHALPPESILPHLYQYNNVDAVRHLFTVTSSLDSMIVGEGQIAGQVKQAYELSKEYDAVGPYFHQLFQTALKVSKRVRTETGIAHGHVSVSSAAVDYVKQVFDHFNDKTVLVIGAGKMGELTLKHLQALEPKRILVTNRSPQKAIEVAEEFCGQPVPWDNLDDALARADIVLSTTGATEPIMTKQRYKKILAKRTSGRVVILDIAVPRDFDPDIHDGDRTCLFNIDDLTRLKEETLEARRKHIGPAKNIIEQELKRFQKDWSRRQNGPIIAKLKQDSEGKRQAVVDGLFKKLNGRLNDQDRKEIEYAFYLFENRLLHGPISALAEETQELHNRHTLLEALRTLFRLRE